MSTKKRKPNLAERAMLVHLRIGQFTGQRKDILVTNEVIVTKKSAVDAGAWWTYHLSKADLSAINETGRRMRRIHHEMTLPWMDGGLRILPSARFMEYSKVMRKLQAEYEEAVSAFITDYPNIIARAKKRLGALAKDCLPSAQVAKQRLAFEYNILPVPTAADFRVRLSADEANTIKENVSRSIEEMTNIAMSSVWEKLTELIEKVEAAMGQSGKKFKNSLISNLSDFCELIPKLNLTDDSKLEELRREAIAKLAGLKPDALREDKVARKRAHKSAKEIMEKIKGYTK